MSDHGHGHGIPTGGGSRRPLIMALAISATILVVEVVGAVLTGSLALLADAGHMLTDVAGLSLAVAATVLAARESTPNARGDSCAPRSLPLLLRPPYCWPLGPSCSSKP